MPWRTETELFVMVLKNGDKRRQGCVGGNPRLPIPESVAFQFSGLFSTILNQVRERIQVAKTSNTRKENQSVPSRTTRVETSAWVGQIIISVTTSVPVRESIFCETGHRAGAEPN